MVTLVAGETGVEIWCFANDAWLDILPRNSASECPATTGEKRAAPPGPVYGEWLSPALPFLPRGAASPYPRFQELAMPRHEQRLRRRRGRLARFGADCLSTGRRRLQARLRPQRVSKPGTLAQMFTFAHVPWFPLTGVVRGA